MRRLGSRSDMGILKAVSNSLALEEDYRGIAFGRKYDL